MTEYKEELDVRNERCPIPVKKTKNLLKNMSTGEILHVMATDPYSEQDIEILLVATNDRLIESRCDNGVFHYFIERN